MAEYRLLAQEEYPTAVNLWVEVFGVEAPFFETLLEGGDHDDFSLAAFDGDKLVASVHVFMRWFRDQTGEPRKVGGIGSVSTLPEARAQGHSFKLLEMAIEEMETRDCVWSYLGTGVNDHYAKHGWRTLSTPFMWGRLRHDLSEALEPPVTVDEDVLARMAGLHMSDSYTCPMANSRSAEMWKHAVRYRVTGDAQRVYLAHADDKAAAYLVTGEWNNYPGLIEAANHTDCEHHLDQLIRSHLAEAVRNGATIGRSMLPEHSVGTRAFMGC